MGRPEIPEPVLGEHCIELDDGRKHSIAFFKGTYGGEFSIDRDEIDRVEWFRPGDTDGLRMHPECALGLEKYFKEREK